MKQTFQTKKSFPVYRWPLRVWNPVETDLCTSRQSPHPDLWLLVTRCKIGYLGSLVLLYHAMLVPYSNLSTRHLYKSLLNGALAALQRQHLGELVKLAVCSKQSLHSCGWFCKSPGISPLVLTRADMRYWIGVAALMYFICSQISHSHHYHENK